VDQFRLRNNQEVTYLVPLIDDKLRETIFNGMDTYFPETLSTRKRKYEADVRTLTAVVQIMLVPQSKIHFLNMLSYSCKNYSVEQSTAVSCGFGRVMVEGSYGWRGSGVMYRHRSDSYSKGNDMII
jgi:hypothetical protein